MSSAATPTAQTTSFDIIFTYSEREQEHGRLSLDGPAPMITEYGFLAAILQTLDDEEALELIKLSVCLISNDPSDNDAPSWLIPRNGKFFFNPEVNRNADTLAMAAFRDTFVANRKKQAADTQTAKK